MFYVIHDSKRVTQITLDEDATHIVQLALDTWQNKHAMHALRHRD